MAGRTKALGSFVTRDQRLLPMLEVLPVVARSQCILLITGETGTGKEHLARLVHALSPRRRGPFIKIGCAGLPEELLAGQVFGYASGGLSPGEPPRPGGLQLAARGTLLLDEVGELPARLQKDLQRLLESRVYRAWGGGPDLPFSARLLATSQSPLHELVHRQVFREDLCHHLSLLRFHLPPLRERRGNLALLIEHFLDRLNLAAPGPPHTLSQQAWRVLSAYQFPGNLRELRNILEQAVMVCQGGSVGLGDLPYFLAPGPREGICGQELPAGRQEERQALLRALDAHGWRRRETAQALGLNRTTLWRRMRRLGLGAPGTAGARGLP